MNIAGLTIAKTKQGAEIIDGACCISQDQNIYAVAEERITRKKHQAGSQTALLYLCQQLDLSLEDIDYFCLSSCGEAPLQKGDPLSIHKNDVWYLQDMGIAQEKIIINPSHHLSHALCAYYSQQDISTEKCLIVVLDYHGNSGEKNSYYLFDGNSYQLLHRDSNGLSIGAVYHQVADLLGYDGATQCGVVMAIASFIADNTKSLTLFESDGLATKACFTSGKLAEYLSKHNPDILKKILQAKEKHRSLQFTANIKYQNIEQSIITLANTVQQEIQQHVYNVIKQLYSKQKFDKVILSGGVASNCQLLGYLQKKLDSIIVQGCYAPGDAGQAIGNVIYTLKNKNAAIPAQIRQPFLGPIHIYSHSWLNKICEHHNLIQYTDNLIGIMASLLSDGYLLACYNGRSEFGPRALGNRSILAHPGKLALKHKLNHQIKQRQWFRPFGTVVLQEHIQDIVPIISQSHYMELAGTIAKPWQERLAAICHVDGTTRVQTITDKQHPYYLRSLLLKFYEYTNLPCLLNTSLNEACKPIVETYEQAIDLFINKDIDALFIGKQLLVKPYIKRINLSPHLV